ncbi:MAG: chemotaxis protein CheC, partial [Promethearchaeota archaeon]
MSYENKNFDQATDLKLTAEQIDILKEVGNIGSGNAISALSNLLNNKIEVSLTAVNIIPFWKFPELFKKPFNEVFGIFSDLRGYSDFSIIQIFTKKSIINLINELNDTNDLITDYINEIDDLDEFSYSIISEVGNLLSGHYANALADLLSIKLVPEVPKIALESLTA